MWKRRMSILLEKERCYYQRQYMSQTTVQYYMHGLEEYSMKMLDYIISISKTQLLLIKE